MKRPSLLVGIAFALSILIALVFVYPHQMIAPGALIPQHASIQGNCFSCHVPLSGVSARRCIVCHVAVDIGVRTTRGLPITKPSRRAAFHAHLKEADCTACHTDHAANLLTGGHTKTFNHSLLKPAIASMCAACHDKPKDELHAKINGGCAQCHRTSGWKPASFAHDRYFKLDRAHNVNCATCHKENVFTRYTCYGCHAHQPAQIASKHTEEGISNIGNCVRCHRSAEGEGEGGEGGEDDD